MPELGRSDHPSSMGSQWLLRWISEIGSLMRRLFCAGLGPLPVKAVGDVQPAFLPNSSRIPEPSQGGRSTILLGGRGIELQVTFSTGIAATPQGIRRLLEIARGLHNSGAQDRNSL